MLEPRTNAEWWEWFITWVMVLWLIAFTVIVYVKA